MTTLTVELPPELYDLLKKRATQKGKPEYIVAQELLAESLRPPQEVLDREKSRAVLRNAGLLVEPTPDEQSYAARCNVTLEEVRSALDKAGGLPLSEVVIAQRGHKHL